MTIRYMVVIGNGDLLFFDAARNPLPAVEPVIGYMRERLAMREPEQDVNVSGYEWGDVLKGYSLEERNNAMVYEAKSQTTVDTAPISCEQHEKVRDQVRTHDAFPSWTTSVKPLRRGLPSE